MVQSEMRNLTTFLKRFMFSLLVYIDIFIFVRLYIYTYLFISQENLSFVEKPEEWFFTQSKKLLGGVYFIQL